MSLLKNITTNTVSLQMFNTANPTVNFTVMPVILSLTPGETVNENLWLVSNITDPSSHKDLIANYISQQILTRISI